MSACTHIMRFANVAWNVDDARIGTSLYRERTTLYPASLYAETRIAPMRCHYYDDFAVSHFYPYLKPDLLWPTSMM